MVGLRSLGKCTVRELSYHLYNKSDDNTVLDDALKRLMERNLVQRRVIQAHERKAYGRSTYLWNLTQDGAKIIEKSKA
jgi:predicted ArsR family transcriptional regulator